MTAPTPLLHRIVAEAKVAEEVIPDAPIAMKPKDVTLDQHLLEIIEA